MKSCRNILFIAIAAGIILAFGGYIIRAQTDTLIKKKIADLELANSVLKAENAKLQQELAGAVKENDYFKARLGSEAGVKKATRELKRQMFSVGKEIKKKAKATRVIEGNRGFLIKNGSNTQKTLP